VVAVRVVWEMARVAVVKVVWGQRAFSLDLGCSCGEEIDVEVLSIIRASS
jgi:hypothetical protein